jgi:hypothetical protein
VSVQIFSGLIQRHEGDPRAWVSAVKNQSENPEAELSIAIQQAPSVDRFYTARALSNALSRYQMENAAYMQIFGRKLDRSRADGYQKGQEVLNMIILALDCL